MIKKDKIKASEKDDKMYLLRNECGEICTIPDDSFNGFGDEIQNWVMAPVYNPLLRDYLKPEKAIDYARYRHRMMNVKMERIEKAYALYLSVGDKGLRYPPFVIENYVVTNEQGRLERVFLFKEENNGNTYRAVDPLDLVKLSYELLT